MKKNIITIVITLLLSSTSLHAQDIITLRNGDQIRARVTEISLSEIRYKRFEHLDGPTIVVPRASVFAINYENGTREVINPLTETSPAQTVNRTEQHANVSNRPQNVREINRAQTVNETNRRHSTSNILQQGNMAFGGSLLLYVDAGHTLFGIGAKLPYNATDAIRLDGSISYFFPARESRGGISVSANMWDFNLNVHYLVALSDNAILYPLVGFGILAMRANASGFGQSARVNQNHLGINLGVGIDFQISQTMIFNIEPRLKRLSESSTSVFFVQTGLAFRF